MIVHFRKTGVIKLFVINKVSRQIIKILLVINSFFFGVEQIHAQASKVDSVSAPKAVQASETSKRAGGVDTVINYSAKDSIVYSLRTHYMHLYGKSQMQYQAIELQSERIDVNWDNATLYGYGLRDTINPDSIIGKPVMKDGGDTYFGSFVMYNFRTKKGKVTLGSTSMDNGYYMGKEIKKVEPEVLCVSDGTYTTCDSKEPHFYFASPKMKVFVRDKVVAEPIYLYVADVPVFALPFGVFPAHGGRSSGLVAPAYGEDARYGWYLVHLGYFWAASDYWDITTLFDIYSRGLWQNQTEIRYKLRDSFDGTASASISSKPTGEPTDPGYTKERDYHAHLSHNQVISPTSHLDVDFTFMSKDYYRNYSFNLDEVLRQNVYSNATYFKSWENSNRSLTISVSRNQELMTGAIDMALPRVSFWQGTIFPFRKKVKTRGLSTSLAEKQSFLDLLGFDYKADFNNNISRVFWSDYVKPYPEATQLEPANDYERIYKQFLKQHVSLALSPKVGYFTVSPSISFTDNREWVKKKYPVRNMEDSLKEYKDYKDHLTRGNLSAGISSSTKLYGILQPNIFGVKAIRHALTPVFTISYDKQVYGKNMEKYAMRGSLSIGNNFEMKYQKNDSARTEEKVQLLNLNINASYNFAADSMGLSPINTSFSTDVGRILGISGSAVYDPYMYDSKARSRVNKLWIKEKGKLGHITNFIFMLSSSFRGEKKQKSDESGIPEKVIEEQEKTSRRGMLGGQIGAYSIYNVEEADFSIPWNINISFSFSQSQPYPGAQISRSSSVSGSLSFNLTEKWQISLQGLSYDFVRKKHYIHSVSVTRDLHCWEMSFSWCPMGFMEGYKFELRVKASQLQDVRVTKQSSNRGIYSR